MEYTCKIFLNVSVAKRFADGENKYCSFRLGRESIAAKLVANLITEASAIVQTVSLLVIFILACNLYLGQSMGYLIFQWIIRV
jgi:hypothetical protein